MGHHRAHGAHPPCAGADPGPSARCPPCEVPATGLLLGVAEQVAADRRRRTETRWGEGTWPEWAARCRRPAPAPWAETYTGWQRPPTFERLLLTYAADDGGRAGQALL